MDNVRTVTLASIFRSLSYSTIWIFSSIYITIYLGMPVFFSAVLFFVGGSLSSFGQIAGGRLGDRLGHKYIFVSTGGIIVVLMALLSIFHGISNDFQNYFIFVSILMMVNAFQSPSANALVSNSSSVQLKGFSIIRVGNNIGWGFGPAIGGYIIETYGFGALFRYALVMTVISFLISLMVSNTTVTTGKKMSFKTSNLSLIIISVAALLLFTVQAQETVTLSIFSDGVLSGNYTDIGIIYMTNGIFVIMLQPLIYLLSSRIKPYYSLLSGSFTYTLGYTSFGLDHNFLQLILSTIIFTIGEDLAFPAGYAMIAEISRKERIGTNIGIYNAFMSAGRSIGPLFGGYALSVHLSSIWLWLIVTIPGYVSCIILVFSYWIIERYRLRFTESVKNELLNG